MLNPEVQNQLFPYLEQQNQTRTFFISQLFQIRSQHPEITRDASFLALAIIDKFLDQIYLKKAPKQLLSYTNKGFMLASLWISLKFLYNSPLLLRQVLNANDFVPSICQIIEAESRILEVIQFVIPTEHTYAMMVQSFLSTAKQDSKEIAARCLKFYCAAIRISNQFVLCGQLGPKIFEVIKTKTLKDKRIKQAYILIKKSMGQSNVLTF